MSESRHEELEKVIAYMKSHWPSDVRPEWQVSLEEYPVILKKVVQDFAKGKTKNNQFIRIAGLSGSGKTSQILPAVEAYCEKNNIKPILVAARKFVEYHPHYEEIKKEYGEENLRKKTDEFSTIMMFLTLNALTREGYDIVLDVTLLDPVVEQILVKMLKEGNYTPLFLMIATSPTVTEYFLGGRSWRHTKETEEEFIRATGEALEFYAKETPNFHIILWSVYDLEPIYDGEIKDSLAIFNEYSSKTDLPKADDDARREAKIQFLSKFHPTGQ
ncbi:zeta toxin family protein [Candidatus Saccharibacteria bacterium]|nr:zeta toxin family protein [Candidatus Saccharibacteria bacterium]